MYEVMNTLNPSITIETKSRLSVWQQTNGILFQIISSL